MLKAKEDMLAILRKRDRSEPSVEEKMTKVEVEMRELKFTKICAESRAEEIQKLRSSKDAEREKQENEDEKTRRRTSILGQEFRRVEGRVAEATRIRKKARQ